VKVGDDVVIRYYEALALKLNKSANPQLGMTEVAMVERAPEGGRPAAAVGREMKGNMKVVLIKKGDKSVTLQGKDRHIRWIKVKDPRVQPYLGKIKAGDIVDINYKEALAVSVERA
jgi:hypothetical protein